MLSRALGLRLLGGLAIAVVVHYASVWALPRVMMWKLFQTLTQSAGASEAPKQPILPPLADASARRVVMPNPDLLYGLCALDLARGPAIVRADPKLSSYWSIALYASNSDHFFVLNDREAGQRPVHLLITAQRHSAAAAASVHPDAQTRSASLGAMDEPRTIVAHSNQVLLLMRVLVEDPSRGTQALEAARSSLKCSTS